MKLFIVVEAPEDAYDNFKKTRDGVICGVKVDVRNIASEGIMRNIAPLVLDPDFIEGRFDKLRERFPGIK